MEINDILVTLRENLWPSCALCNKYMASCDLGAYPGLCAGCRIIMNKLEQHLRDPKRILWREQFVKRMTNA